AHIFTKVLPNVVDKALLYQNIDQEAMKNQVQLLLDQVYIREELPKGILLLSLRMGRFCRAEAVCQTSLYSMQSFFPVRKSTKSKSNYRVAKRLTAWEFLKALL